MTPQQTSLDARASLSEGRISRLQSTILAILGQEGPLTDEEIILLLNSKYALPSVVDTDASIRSRRAELVGQGRVIDTGEKRRSRSGRLMIVWGLVRIEPKRAFDPGDLDSGMRPNNQPGRPDRYVNLERAKTQAADQARIVQGEAERDRLRGLPWLDSPPRVVFGEVLCRVCQGRGGNKLEGACWACGGTGVSGRG